MQQELSIELCIDPLLLLTGVECTFQFQAALVPGNAFPGKKKKKEL